MAIKMDGHTITALKLKASNGSEVIKQLAEEGTIPTPTATKQITANGTYDVTTKASAVVNVPAPEINLQNKTATANGEVTADEGYDGLGVVTVAVSGDTPTYQEKTATANGVVLPDEGYDALSKVTVNVPAPTPTISVDASGLVTATAGDKTATHQLSSADDADFIAGNIKEGVTLFGLLGTLASGGSLPVTEGTFTTTKAADDTYTHNANLEHYIFVWYYEDWETAIADTTSTLFMPVYGAVSFHTNFGKIPSALLTASGNKGVGGFYVGYKPSAGEWNDMSRPTSMSPVTVTKDKVCWGSGYGNFVGTYKYFIIDTSSLEA